MKNNEYILFLDMDGVLVDYDGGFSNLTGGIKSGEIYKKYGPDKVRDISLATGMKFWFNLGWERGGQELWNAASSLFNDIRILSSAGDCSPDRFKMVEAGKRLWIKNNIPTMPQSKVYIVNGKRFKKNYATKNSILVDDMPITIKEWNQAGGFGILHNSHYYRTTIEELEDISRPMNLAEIVKRIKR